MQRTSPVAKWKIFKRNWAPATGKHWQVLDKDGQCHKVFHTFQEALEYTDRKARTASIAIPRMNWGTVEAAHSHNAVTITHAKDGFTASIHDSEGSTVDIPFGQLMSVAAYLLGIREHYVQHMMGDL